jgi:hypothetical protein
MTPDYLERLNRRNPPNIRMKNAILKLIFSRLGPTITAIVSAVLGFLVTKLASYQIMLDADLQTQISGALTGLIWLTVNQLVNRYMGDKVEIIQQAYGLEADRWLGPVTTAAAVNPDQVPRPLEAQGLRSVPANTRPFSAIVIPSWAVMVLKLIPWRTLFAYVLQKWLGITPAQFEEIIKTVQFAEKQPVDGEEKGVFVISSIARAYPQFKPHERQAAVALAVAGLASDGTLKLS